MTRLFILFTSISLLIIPIITEAQSPVRPGIALQPELYGANFLLNGNAELGPVDVPEFGYRPPHEWGRPTPFHLAGEVRIIPWGSVVDGQNISKPSEPSADFGQFLLRGMPGMESELRRNVTIRNVADEIDEGAVTLRLSGWFGGIGEAEDSVLYVVTILDAGRRVLQRDTLGNVTRQYRNNQTMLLYDELSITIPENSEAIETRLIFSNGGLVDNLEMVFLSANHDNVYIKPADLTVTAMSAPPGGFSGAQIELEWTVTNIGETATEANWADRILLSSEPSATRGNRFNLQEFPSISRLEPGESYTNRQTVTLPEAINGTFYIMVETDTRNRINEYTRSNNVSEPSRLKLTTSSYPDLQVTSVVVPPMVFSGDSIDVQWTVKNFGTGPTVPSRWTDAIYLGSSDELDFNFFGLAGQLIQVNDMFVTSFERVGALQPGESYTVTNRIKLPDSVIGEQHLFVFADKPDGFRTPIGGDVYEFEFVLNNWLSNSMNIILTPPPDLTVTSVWLHNDANGTVNSPGTGSGGDSPAFARLTSGSTRTVSWDVQNVGPGPTRTPFWQDLIFLSTSAEFDADQAVLLRSSTIGLAEPLLSDSSYIAEALVRVPDGFQGEYFIHVFTNFSGQVFEYEFIDNNVAALGPIQVELGEYPDLAAGSVAVAGDATAGERLRIDLEVANVGAAMARGARTDRLFISENSAFVSEEAIILGSITTSDEIPVGEVQRISRFFRLPTQLSQQETTMYYVHLVVNADSSIYEWPGYENNIVSSDLVSVRPHEGAQLAVSSIEVAEQAIAGQTMSFAWTVINEGMGSMQDAEWQELLMLIPADTALADTLTLDILPRTVPLQPGEQFERFRDVRLPQGLDQQYNPAVQLVYPVAGSGIPEQVLFVSDQIVMMDPGPRYDLVITATDAPANVAAGQIFELSWTVTNQGVDDISDTKWFDTLYLLENPKDAGRVRPVGRWDHEGELPAGASYTATVEVEIPVDLDSNLYWVVTTDTRNRVFEYQAADNNTSVVPVSVTLPSETDLIVTSVQFPDEVTAGDSFTITWEVENIGNNTARGRIRDGVYLMPAEWGASKVGEAFLLGIADRDIDLEPGQKMRGSQIFDAATIFESDSGGKLTSPVPGVSPGSYKVAVRTNLRGNIPESNRSNNLLISEETVEVKLPSLQNELAVGSVITSGQARHFSFDAPAGQDLLFTARTTDSSVASINLYVSFGQVPTRTHHQFSAVEPFTSQQQLNIPDTEEGVYYVMVQVDYSDSDTTEVELDVRIRGFEVDSSVPVLGGNIGPVTVRVNGSRFTEDTKIFLESSTGRKVEPFELYFRSRNLILTRFHLEGVPTGLYDVVAELSDGTQTRYTQGFEVINGTGADVRASVLSPRYIRGTETYELEVTISNNGDINALDQFVLVEIFGFNQEINRSDNTSKSIPAKIQLVREHFPETVFQTPRDYDSKHHAVPFENSMVLPLWFYEIPPGQTISFRVEVEHDIRVPITMGGGAAVRTIRSKGPNETQSDKSFFTSPGTIWHLTNVVAMPESDFTRSGAIIDIETAYGFMLLNDIYEETLEELFQQSGRRTMMRNTARNGLIDIITTFAEGGLPSIEGVLTTAGGGVAGYIIVGAIYSNPASALLATGLGLGAMVAGTLYTMWETKKTRDAAIEQASALILSELDPITADRIRSAQHWERTQTRGSYDPNDIIGPEGFGEERWVGIQKPLDYRIRYENDPELASAPAQIVRIAHPLDPNADIRTFRLGQFGFADTTFRVPDNVSNWSARLDIRPSHGLFVDFTAGIDIQRNEAFWLFRSIDPLTGDVVTDPLRGYLPVNDTTGVGEGFVTYTIRPRQDAVTGDTLHAAASIFFDDNAPIDTPPIFNTIDADLPESVVLPILDEDVFEIRWQGSDIGAGFARADVYISVDEGPFERVAVGVNDESVLINKRADAGVYRFFTLAYDNAGNREPMKTSADAVTATSVLASISDLPHEFTLRPVFPNPFNPATTLPFDLPAAGEVDINVYDILGRRIVSLSPGLMPAGRHQQKLNLQRFATGVYFAEIQVRSDDGSRWRAVQPMTLIK
jgi:hypothetical protein